MVKEELALEGFGATAMALAMIASFALTIGGIRLLRNPANRGRGRLMLVAAAVLFANVLIWTV